jgi:formate-dependent nitrite reductase membrane component NrfD
VWILLFVIIFFVIDINVSVKFEEIAKEKGHQGYFWWCFWLGIIGYCMVIALPDRNPAEKETQTIDELPDL